MKILVLVFHPNMERSQSNKKLSQSISNDSNITVRYLYEEYPDFKIDVKKEQSMIENHDRIVIQFPFQWYSSPALFKQWQDDVLEYGWAYGSSGNTLHNKELMLAVTTGAPEEVYSSSNQENITIDELLSPIRATSKLIGIKYLKPFVIHGVASKSPEVLNNQYEGYYNYITSD